MLLLQGFHNELLNRRVSAEFIISQQMGTPVTETEPRTHAGHQQCLLTGRALHRGRLSCVLTESSRVWALPATRRCVQWIWASHEGPRSAPHHRYLSRACPSPSYSLHHTDFLGNITHGLKGHYNYFLHILYCNTVLLEIDWQHLS